MEVRLETKWIQLLSDAPLVGRLLALPANIRLVCRCKHSSLIQKSVNYEQKSFITLRPGGALTWSTLINSDLPTRVECFFLNNQNRLGYCFNKFYNNGDRKRMTISGPCLTGSRTTRSSAKWMSASVTQVRISWTVGHKKLFFGVVW